MVTERQINTTNLYRAFTLRDLQRNYGKNSFSFTVVKNTAAIYGCGAHNIADILRNSGWLVRVGRGQYHLTDDAFKMLETCRQEFR